MSYSVVLPAPGDLIDSSGQPTKFGWPAPGFSGINLTSNYSVGVNRSRSNRGITSSDEQHYWSFGISYHPMKQEEYTSVENFILGHNARKRPFYVSLPNYFYPNSKDFAAFANTNEITVTGVFYAGESIVEINSTNINLLPGCFINFRDPEDALHEGAYKITRVETPEMYVGGAVAADTLRISVFPPLQRDVSANTILQFIKPQFRVIMKNDLNPQYDKDGLVSVSLQVEELLP